MVATVCHSVVNRSSWFLRRRSALCMGLNVRHCSFLFLCLTSIPSPLNNYSILMDSEDQYWNHTFSPLIPIPSRNKPTSHIDNNLRSIITFSHPCLDFPGSLLALALAEVQSPIHQKFSVSWAENQTNFSHWYCFFKLHSNIALTYP